MIAVTVGLIINNIQIIFHGGQHVNFSMVAYFEMSATLVSIAVIFLLRRMNSKLTSPIVIMEIQEWQIDSVASFGMCIAFFLPQIIDTVQKDGLRPCDDRHNDLQDYENRTSCDGDTECGFFVFLFTPVKRGSSCLC